MPQPFEPLPGQKINNDFRILETRPDCAVKIACVASEWVHVERTISEIFGHITGDVELPAADTVSNISNWPAHVAMREIQSLNTRIDVFKAATEVILPPEKRSLFEAIALQLRRRAGDRNDIVHGFWNTVDSYPKDVLLRIDEWAGARYVRYTPKDFDRIIERIIATGQSLTDFGWDWVFERMRERQNEANAAQYAELKRQLPKE